MMEQGRSRTRVHKMEKILILLQQAVYLKIACLLEKPAWLRVAGVEGVNMTIRALRLQLALALALLCFLAPCAVAQAQTYPSKPIKLVLPYAPGGIIDYVGRTLAQKLTENIGQPVVAENRPGAGGILGTDSGAGGAPAGR